MFSKAKWKREVVQNHKFDFVYVEDFKQNDTLTRIKYVFLILLVIKIFLIYVADLWTAGILLIFDRWSSTIKPVIEFDVSKWIYVGCIFMSFILLIWDWNEAVSIIVSKDIGHALTSIVAYRYYALRSFAHYGFFCKINNQKKKIDDIAFFVFFTFKGWKRLILADAPRQVVNAITLYSIIQSNLSRDWTNIQAYGHNTIERLTMALMAFTFMSFVVSASLLALAFILYIPLLFHIRGNLKEYCCHKIDKRIDELVKNHYRRRNMEQRKIARAEAKGDFNHLKKRKHKNRQRRQPTLPDLDNVPHVPSIPPPLPAPVVPPPPIPVVPINNLHEPIMMTSRPPPYLQSYNPNLHTNSPGLPYNPNPPSPSLRPTYNSNPQHVQNQPRLNPPRMAYNLQTSLPHLHNSNLRSPSPNPKSYHSNNPGRSYI